MSSKSRWLRAIVPARPNRNRARFTNARTPAVPAACSNPVAAAVVHKARTKVRAARVVVAAVKNSTSDPANAVAAVAVVAAILAMVATVMVMAIVAAVLRRNRSNLPALRLSRGSPILPPLFSAYFLR